MQIILSMEYLSPSEAVILNPILGSRPVQLVMNANKPVYAAAANGIYLVKKGQYMMDEGYKAILMGFTVVFSFLFLIAGLAAVTTSFELGRMIGAVLLTMAVAGLFFSWWLWKDMKKARYKKTLPVELVVPWGQVRSIMVMNVRDVNTGTMLNPIIREVGDWHVFTIDGYEIIIPEVDDPFNKLEYVKNRFGLRF